MRFCCNLLRAQVAPLFCFVCLFLFKKSDFLPLFSTVPNGWCIIKNSCPCNMHQLTTHISVVRVSMSLNPQLWRFWFLFQMSSHFSSKKFSAGMQFNLNEIHCALQGVEFQKRVRTNHYLAGAPNRIFWLFADILLIYETVHVSE